MTTKRAKRPQTIKNQRFPGQPSPSEKLVMRGPRLVHQHKSPPTPGPAIGVRTRGKISEGEHYQSFEDPLYLASLARDVDRRLVNWGMARDGVVVR